MLFVSIPNYRLSSEGTDKGYFFEETINVDHISSMTDSSVSMTNGNIIPTSEEAIKKLRTFLSKKGYTITKLGE